MKIKIRLLIASTLLLIFLIIILTIGWIVVNNFTNVLKEHTQHELEIAANLKEHELNSFFDIGIDNFEVMSTIKLLNYNVNDLKNIQKLRQNLVTLYSIGNFFSEYFILDLNGKIIASTNINQEGKIKESEPYFIYGKNHPYIQYYYYDISSNQPVIIYSTPLRDVNNNIIAVFAGRLKFQQISDLLLPIRNISRTSEAFLVNSFNYMLTESRFKNNTNFNKIIFSEAIKNCLNGKSGYSESNDYRGVPSQIVYRWQPESKTCLIVRIDSDEITTIIHIFNKLILIFIGFMVLGVIILSLFVSQMIIFPIKKLKEDVEEITKGNLELQLSESYIFEFQGLIDSLNRILASLKLAILKTGLSKVELGFAEAVKAKEEAEERYKVLVDSSPDCIKLIGLDGKLIYMNNGGLKEHKFKKPEDAVGWDLLSSIVETQRSEVANALKRAINGETVSMDINHVAGKTTRAWCSETFVPVKDKKGTVKFIFGVSRDISKEKRNLMAIEKKTFELEKFAQLSVNREEKMVELKKRIAELESQLKNKRL